MVWHGATLLGSGLQVAGVGLALAAEARGATGPEDGSLAKGDKKDRKNVSKRILLIGASGCRVWVVVHIRKSVSEQLNAASWWL